MASAKMNPPYIPQDAQEVSQMIAALESATKSKRKGGARKSTFDVKGSQDGIQVQSWKFQDWDYKRPDLPTYARGLFTTKNRRNEHEIVVRGYDKFFNVGEVRETKWENIISRTNGPYELTLKENGCIIFISGLEDDTLLVCSKHSTGDRTDIQVSHASAGETRIEKQLAALGKSKADFARELRQRNVTAVAELCDDTFEEHILAYGPDKAGLYLHGLNLNLPKFATYPSPVVQDFADEWGFRKTGLIVMQDINEVKGFLEEVAETGAHDGRDVEGFVVRCRMSPEPNSIPFHDWFFKYKFEEPYLMYRQWRECTKAMISGNKPKYSKHIKITEQYLAYARHRLATNPQLAKLYNQNHGIIALRNDFLEYKNLKGADAANLDDSEPMAATEVTGDVILCPIATIGCGKTTIALALVHLFGWGHVQNDNISGKGRPPRFVKAVLAQLKDHPVVFADRNNAQRHERKQLIEDLKHAHLTAKLVALHFKHSDESIDEIRRITQERVLERGDNHQTIHAATDKQKFIDVMEGFVNRFEPCNTENRPDNGFDYVIDLDPTADSLKNLETVVTELNKVFPNLVQEVPGPEQLSLAIEAALAYRPDFKHDIPDRSRKDKGKGRQTQPTERKRPLEYVSVMVDSDQVVAILQDAFKGKDSQTSKLYMQLKQTRRVQPKFHVTLMHRASAGEYPDLWKRYTALHEMSIETLGPNSKVGECEVQLERVVFDDRLMAIVVRLFDKEDQWQCVNRVAHITVGTRDDTVKPKESNGLLARWLENGSGPETGIGEVVFVEKVTLKGTVTGVLSR